MSKFVSDNGPVEVALFDGYSVGDRLLEGVMFECVFDSDDKIKVSIAPSCADYFSNFNQAKWLRSVEETVNARDGQGFACDSFQDEHGNDVWIEDEAGAISEATPKAIPLQITKIKGPGDMLSLRDLIAAKKQK